MACLSVTESCCPVAILYSIWGEIEMKALEASSSTIKYHFILSIEHAEHWTLCHMQNL